MPHEHRHHAKKGCPPDPAPMPLATAEDRRLYWTLQNRRRPGRLRAVGTAVRELRERGTFDRLRDSADVADLLRQWLPAALTARLAIDSFRGGRLKLVAEQSAPAFLFQRRWQDRLLERFQTEAPHLGVRSVSVQIGDGRSGR